MSESEQILRWPGGSIDFSGGAVVMGILNVTPDSFSDGGLYFDTQRAVEHGLQMVSEGAAIIDIGAESTRPGAKAVSASEQIARCLPVLRELFKKTNIPVSIDTSDVEVAGAAIEAGASIINDITAFAGEGMARLAAEANVPVILMHMPGTPQTMQNLAKYEDVVGEVLEYLLGRAGRSQELGIAAERIIIDPGIGFGKTAEHNILLLKHLERFTHSGYRVLVGTSRKKFIGMLTGKEKPEERVFGTAASVAIAVEKGASVVRVHDVGAMSDVVKVANALRR